MAESTDTEIMTSLFISGAKVTPCKRTGVCPHGICLDRALLQLIKHLACHVEFLQARLKPCTIPARHGYQIWLTKPPP
jgi:hypothetical protein